MDQRFLAALWLALLGCAAEPPLVHARAHALPPLTPRVSDPALPQEHERQSQEERAIAVELSERPERGALVVGELLLQRAPELSGLTAVKGASIGSVLELRGKVVLIEFWSTHCSVCRYLVPVLNDYHARFGPQGLVVLGITNEPVVVADRAARELGIEYGVQSDVQALTTRAYQASALPALYLIDRTGTVRAVHLGYTSRGMSELGELVAELVRGP